MAKPDHVEIVNQGAAAILKWREEHPNERLDLSEADLREGDLRGADLHEANLRGAILKGADLRGASLEKADLRGSCLREAKLERSILHCAKLDETTEIKDKWRLVWQIVADEAILLEGQRSKIKKIGGHSRWLSKHFLDFKHFLGHRASGRDLYKADLSEANLSGANLQEANLHMAKLHGTDLFGANLNMADLGGANLRGAILIRANLCSAYLLGADLSEAQFSSTDIRWAYFFQANLYGADLTNVRGAHHAHLLETVQLTPTAAGGHAVEGKNDAIGFDLCDESTLFENQWNWERLRTVGRLPLFGLSYTALILIPIVFYGLAFYNSKVELIRTWAKQVAVLRDHPMHIAAEVIVRHLHTESIPSLSLVLLGSTVLLAVASTLYTLFCPSRIKEFSCDQWCDQLGQSLLHYRPLAWKHRWTRLICMACYALGGAGALSVIGSKVWRTAVFIVKHSVIPWPLQ
jgi:uncharacterized protein YjbI with pentapeptide repeats